MGRYKVTSRQRIPDKGNQELSADQLWHLLCGYCWGINHEFPGKEIFPFKDKAAREAAYWQWKDYLFSLKKTETEISTWELPRYAGECPSSAYDYDDDFQPETVEDQLLREGFKEGSEKWNIWSRIYTRDRRGVAERHEYAQG